MSSPSSSAASQKIIDISSNLNSNEIKIDNFKKELKSYHITSFSGNQIEIKELKEPLRVYRTGDPGKYWTTKPPKTPWQHAIDTAMHPTIYPKGKHPSYHYIDVDPCKPCSLPSWHSAYKDILLCDLCPGTVVGRGLTAPQAEFPGGAEQILLFDINSQNIKKCSWDSYKKTLYCREYKVSASSAKQCILTEMVKEAGSLSCPQQATPCYQQKKFSIGFMEGSSGSSTKVNSVSKGFAKTLPYAVEAVSYGAYLKKDGFQMGSTNFLIDTVCYAPLALLGPYGLPLAILNQQRDAQSYFDASMERLVHTQPEKGFVNTLHHLAKIQDTGEALTVLAVQKMIDPIFEPMHSSASYLKGLFKKGASHKLLEESCEEAITALNTSVASALPQTYQSWQVIEANKAESSIKSRPEIEIEFIAPSLPPDPFPFLPHQSSDLEPNRESVLDAEDLNKIGQTINHVGSAVCDYLNFRERNKAQTAPLKVASRKLIKHQVHQQRQLAEQQIHFPDSSASFEFPVSMNLSSPSGDIAVSQSKGKKLSSFFEKETEKLRDSECNNRDTQMQLENAQSRNNAKIRGVQKKWQKKIRKEQKRAHRAALIKGIAKIFVQEVAQHVPGTQSLSGIVDIAGDFAQHYYSKKISSRNRKGQRQLDNLCDQGDALHQASILNNQNRDHLDRRETQLELFLLHSPNALAPTAHLSGLRNAIEKQSKKVGGIDNLLNSHKEQKNNFLALAAKEQARLDLFQAASVVGKKGIINNPQGFSIKWKHNKPKRIDGFTKEQLTANLQDCCDKASKETPYIDNFSTQKQWGESHLQELQAAEREAKQLLPLRQNLVDFYREKGLRSDLDEQELQAKNVRDTFAGNLQAIINFHQQRSVIWEQSFSLSQGMAQLVDRLTGGLAASEAVSLARDSYTLYQHAYQWKDLYGHLTKFAEHYTNGDLAEAKQTLFAALPGETTLLSQIALMGMAEILTAARIFFVGASLAYRGWKYYESYNQNDVKKGVSEQGLYFRSLGESLQRMQAALSDQLESQYKNLFHSILGTKFELRQEIRANAQKILSHSEQTHYHNFISKIYGHLRFQSHKLNKIENKLKYPCSSNPKQEQRKVLSQFFSEIKEGLEHCQQQDFNMIHLAQGSKNYLRFLYNKPECHTGLMAAILGQADVPNMLMFQQLLTQLLTMLQMQGVKEIVKGDSRACKALGAILQELTISHISLEKLFLKIEGVIQRICENQREVWSIRIQQSLKMHTLRHQHCKQMSLIGLDRQEKIWEEQFLGSAKFFLYDLFVKKSFLPLTAEGESEALWKFSKLYDQIHYYNERIAKAARIADGVFVFISLVFEGVGFTPLLTNAWDNKKGICDEDRKFYEGIIKAENDIEKQKNISLKEIYDRKVLSFNGTNSWNLIKPVYLDLSERKITLLKAVPLCELRLYNPKYEYGTSFTPPLLDVHFLENSPINVVDLANIPTPGVCSDFDYDNVVRELILNFFAFSRAILEGKPALEGNPFNSIQKSCEIIPAAIEGAMPLAFPKKLITHLESQISIELQSIESSQMGTLIPTYDCIVVEGSVRLFINYTFLPNDSKKEAIEFCRFSIASIDKLTVQAFQKDLSGAQKPLIVSVEFLLQVMYGATFAAGLGLPGAGSYKLVNSSLVAPHEVKFLGFYALWDKYPQAFIGFNCQDHTSEEISSNLFQNSIPLTLCEGYMEVIQNIEGKKAEFQKIREDYEEDFSLLMAWLKLVSNVDETILRDKLASTLALFPPEDENLLYDILLRRGSPVSPSVAQISAFVAELHKYPSASVTKLRQQMELLARL